MRVADYIADFLAGITPRVYGVCGAGAMHLNDAIANHPRMKVIATHHEQAAAMAAEADARVTGKIGVVSVTAGPGGSNAITGVACAYVDSIPMMVIAGQVPTSTMVGHSRLRQLGMNELEMVALMQPITKYAMSVREPFMVRYYLEKAYHTATTGRNGPVFLEIPLDVQAVDIDPEHLSGYSPEPHLVEPPNDKHLAMQASICVEMLRKAERPVLLIGNGVRLAGACDDLFKVVCELEIPVVSSWGAADIVPTDHNHYIGRCGLFGDRASNFAVQNADLLLCIGTRLSVGQIGHTSSLFAPKAKKIIVDIDFDELQKNSVVADLPIVADARAFLSALMKAWVPPPNFFHRHWLLKCIDMAEKHPVIQPEFRSCDSGVNAYHFVDELAKSLDDDAIIVTDVGFCFIPTFQSMRLKRGQRLIHSSGVSPMGWGIPAAIGAAMAGKGRQVICLTGDGGGMMNIQELATIAHHKLPISIFVFENDGYATMKIAQNTHFKREVMSGPETGVTLPKFSVLGRAFGLATMNICTHDELRKDLLGALTLGRSRPVLAALHMTPGQLIKPRVQARIEKGKFVPASLDDMWPFLPRDNFQLQTEDAITHDDRVDQRG